MISPSEQQTLAVKSYVEMLKNNQDDYSALLQAQTSDRSKLQEAQQNPEKRKELFHANFYSKMIDLFFPDIERRDRLDISALKFQLEFALERFYRLTGDHNHRTSVVGNFVAQTKLFGLFRAASASVDFNSVERKKDLEQAADNLETVILSMISKYSGNDTRELVRHSTTTQTTTDGNQPKPKSLVYGM